MEWEIAIERGDSQVKLIKLNNNSDLYIFPDHYQVNLPFSFKNGVLEFMEVFHGEAEELNLQIRAFADRNFCDDTPWFKPVASSFAL